MSDEALIEYFSLGDEDKPVADICTGHVSKETFQKKWSEEWEGAVPDTDTIEYMYGTRTTAEDGAVSWNIDVDATTEGAVPITVFVW